MGLPCYLAMTAGEFVSTQPLPEAVAWMACHFSPSGTGLSNLPSQLPDSTLLILDDSIPWDGHDLQRITAQLADTLHARNCCGLLLDFQRTGVREVAEICQHFCNTLPCPVIVSEGYGKALSCPVFLPPLPLLEDLKTYLSPWEGREIWLELALDGMVATVTEEGCVCKSWAGDTLPEPWFSEKELHCRYHWTLVNNSACFTILRTFEDLSSLVTEAKRLGVKGFVGLYQELKN